MRPTSPSILVTGAGGFIGQAVTAGLLKQARSVRPVVRNTPAAQRLGLAVADMAVVPTLTADTDWSPALVGVQVVVHCAARVHQLPETAVDPLAAFRAVNVAGTLNLARQAAEAGVRRFVFISSVKVNGESTFEGHPFRAEDPPAPQDAYAVSKAEAETGLRVLATQTGMELVIIRPPLVYGPGVKGNFAVMVNWIRRSFPLPLGCADNRRSLVALDNLVSLIAVCADPAKSPQAAGEVFLISDGEDVSTTELIRRVARAYGIKARLIPVPTRWLQIAGGMLGKDVIVDRLLGSLVVDASKAGNLLGWRPVVRMEEQLQKMAQYDAMA